MTELQPLALRRPDCRLALARSFIDGVEADLLQARLLDEIPWQQHRLRLFGRAVDAPRLSCWIGDADAAYRYSGVRFEPQPWTPTLAALRDRASAACGERFNSVLANLYRDGRDSMGWHADDEAELGEEPIIGSLSFGAVRRFLVRSRDRSERLQLDLDHGSLLCMAGRLQRHYQHAVPKTARPLPARLNLTFRRILEPAVPAGPRATSPAAR